MERVIVVIGAAGGIGAALVARMAGPGVRLVLSGRRAEPLEQLAASYERAGLGIA